MCVCDFENASFFHINLKALKSDVNIQRCPIVIMTTLDFGHMGLFFFCSIHFKKNKNVPAFKQTNELVSPNAMLGKGNVSGLAIHNH